MEYLPSADPLAKSVIHSIQSGDLIALRQLLSTHSHLASARIKDAAHGNNPEATKTLLHVATDWPGHFPNCADVIGLLISAGADVSARTEGRFSETPLHWAASSDDVAALAALLDHGANIEAPGAVIGGGTPLADAAAFGCWNTARMLLQRGAKTTFWQAAALGQLDRVKAHLNGAPLEPWTVGPARPNEPAQSEVTHAFWSACHGGHLETAQYLLSQGADINWIGHDHFTPLGIAKKGATPELVTWLVAQGAKTTEELRRSY